MAFFSRSTFHRLKRQYFAPALNLLYSRHTLKIAQFARDILNSVRESTVTHSAIYSQGAKLSLSGDAQFDSRGHSAIFGRYVMTLNPSGLILDFCNVSKRVESECHMKEL